MIDRMLCWLFGHAWVGFEIARSGRVRAAVCGRCGFQSGLDVVVT